MMRLCTLLLWITVTNIAHSVQTVVNPPLKFYNSCALRRLVSDPNRYKQYHFWENLLRPMLIRRISGTDGNKLVQKHIKKVFAGLNQWRVDTDQFTERTPLADTQFTNIIATQLPEKAKKLTFTCHFDSKMIPNFVAATDSAVPCAMLLDLAVNLDKWLLLGNGNQAKDYSLRLIFLDGEESVKHWTSTDSLYGSRHLAAAWLSQPDNVDHSKTKLETILPFVLLDLIGERGMTFHNYFSETAPLFEALAKIEIGTLPEKVEFIFCDFPPEKRLHKEKLIETSRKMFSDTQLVASSYGIQDDHIPFLHKGVPVLHLIASPFPSTWHTSNDNEKNLDWEEIENFNRILRVFVAQILHLTVRGCDREGLR